MKQKSITEGSILKTLIVFAVPFMIANILQSLYGAVDLFVVGRYCSAESLAAVSTGTQVTQIITSLITGLTLGSTILIGEYTGSRQFDLVKKTIGTTLTVFAIVAILLSALLLVFEQPLLRVLGTPNESFDLTMQYVAICAMGTIFVCGYNAISAILRGYGDSKSPMYFVLISCILNIVLDFLFVKYFGLGVAGTALATIISQGISMIIAVIKLKKQNFIFDFKLSSFQPDVFLMKRLGKIGIPISFQELMIRISFLYLMVVMNRCGVYAAAVVGISSKYDIFAMLTGTSIASALAAITAQNLGAGKPERARKSLWYGLTFAVTVSFGFWCWAQFAPDTMIRLFSKDEAIIAEGVSFFRYCSYDYILVTIVFILNGYLNGCQKTVWTMISSSAGALLLRIPLVWYFGSHFSGNIGRLGMIAPTVSGIMAIYTLGYVFYEGKQMKETMKKTIA